MGYGMCCRHLFYLHRHPQNASEYADPEPSYNLWTLHHSDVLFHILYRIGKLPPERDGLWLVCSNLSPFHYMATMKPQLPELLVLVSWTIRVLYSLLESLMVLWLPFSRVEHSHFFCKINPVIQLAYSSNFLNDFLRYFAAQPLGGGLLAGVWLLL